MMIYLFVVVLFGVVIFEAYLIYKLVMPIMAIEDHLSEAIAVHVRTLNTMNALLEMPMFYDSPAILKAATEVLEDVKICKAATQQVAEDFVRLSKNKYVTIEEE